MYHRTPASDWSKAPWGLSVLARVASIFTGTSISPDALSRQRPNHYAFRAGRNLPDKEFRYLRRPVFLLNSCLGQFSAATLRWHPFFRSYGAVLPSSLTMLLPSALGFSPHPPVSVYGTGDRYTIAAFPGTGFACFPTRFRSTSQLRLMERFFLSHSFSACTGLFIPRSCYPHASPQF